MRKICFHWAGLLIMLSLLAACGSGAPIRGRGAKTYQAIIGGATVETMLEKVNRRLDLYGYILTRFIDDSHLYWETNWRYRHPDSDQIAEGISNTRTRLFLTAKTRGRNVLRMTGEVQFQMRETEEWITPVIDENIRAHFEGFRKAVAEDLLTGVWK